MFKGPVNVMDLDHEQYGDAVAMKRRGLVLLEGDFLRLTEAGKIFVVTETLHSLEEKGLTVNFPDGSMLTPEGRLILNGSDRVM